MGWLILRAFIAAAVVVAVAEVSNRLPRLGALLLTLPVVSIIAFVMAWTKDADLPAVSRLARETLILVPLGLPFFVPLAFADRLGLSFWSAFAIGVALASATIGLWFWLGPSS
ncbi:MAG: hypothetical protein H0T47_04835 [Planctomycetaceae bacterium]|nr:hypothetical protein [Planctomycetaceae bacterium]